MFGWIAVQWNTPARTSSIAGTLVGPTSDGGEGSAMSLGRADDQHRARRVVRDAVRYGAQQEPPRPGHALVPDDDQIGVALLGDVDDRVGRIPLARVRVRIHAGVAGDLRRRFQRGIDILALID